MPGNHGETHECLYHQTRRGDVIGATEVGNTHSGEWFSTLDEAKVKAERMRETKIQSLQRQLNKIKNLSIKVTEEKSPCT